MSRYNEMCEPCFEDDCRNCAPRDRALHERKRLLSRIRSLENQLRQTVGALEDERSAAGPDDVRESPTLAGHSRIITRARKVLDAKATGSTS